jgi:hypothetical protein
MQLKRWSLGLALLFSLSAPELAAVRAEELSEAQREAIQADVVQIRELQTIAPITIKRVSQAELRAQFLEELEDPEAIEQLKTTKKYNVLLGTVPGDIDLHQVLVNTLSGAVIGQYRPADKTMYLVAEQDAAIGPETKIVVAHEFTHALQDQHFGLEELTNRVRSHDDRAQALRALFEGDASMVELLYERDKIVGEEAVALRRARSEAPPAMLTAPFILQEELKFPYIDGFFFIVELWQTGGFGMIDAAYADPPVSTEQILHPNKYVNREPPVELGLPDLLTIFGPEWRQTYANVMGELELRILIEQFTDSSLAGRAANGWGGDAFAVLEGPGEHVAWVMDSAWDTEEDAREFSDALAFSLERRFGTSRVILLNEPDKLLWSTPVGVIGVAGSAARLAVAYAPERAQAEGVLTALSPAGTAPRLPVATPKPSQPAP